MFKNPSFLQSFNHSLDGLWHCISTQRNFRFHLVAAITVFIVGLMYRLSLNQFVVLIFTVGFVVICEMINTAIESTVDMSCAEYNKYAKIAKDVSSGAVLFSAMMAVIVALLIFLKPDKIVEVLTFVISRPYMWMIVIVYTVMAILFVRGKMFLKYIDKE